MKITVKRSEELAITPLIFKDEKEPPVFVFRTPNSSDMLKFLWTKDLLSVIDDCFVRFENKIEVTDENGKEIEYETYKEFINLGLSGEILAIHQECLNKITEKLNEMTEQAENVEKKSKSGMKSSKAGKKHTPKD
mgnify:CR=1 FL=1